MRIDGGIIASPLTAVCNRQPRHTRHSIVASTDAPNDTRYAAQTEDAVLPERFERIAEQRDFAIGRRVRSVEDIRNARWQKTNRNLLRDNPDRVAIGGIQAEHSIDQTFENRMWLTPPVRVEHQDLIRNGELGAVLLYELIAGACVRLLANWVGWDQTSRRTSRGRLYRTHPRPIIRRQWKPSRDRSCLRWDLRLLRERACLWPDVTMRDT